jgi:hypothetical protein
VAQLKHTWGIRFLKQNGLVRFGEFFITSLFGVRRRVHREK